MDYYLKHKTTGSCIYNRQQLFSTNFEFTDYDAIWDANWDTLDWSQEPVESLTELFKQRAEQLRSQYDHLILYYSGGRDSETVLQIFRDNQIPLDEVVVCRFIEHPTLSLPHVKPNWGDSVTVINITYQFLLNFHRDQDWITNGFGNSGLLHAFSRQDLRFWEKHNMTKPKMRKGKVAHIYGEGLPVLEVKNGKWYSYLSSNSIVMNIYTPLIRDNKEWFFTSANFPKLHAKQSHIAFNIMREHSSNTEYETFSATKNKKLGEITKDALRGVWDSRNDVAEIASTGNLISSLNNKTEHGMLFDFYSKEAEFKDVYINALMKPFAESKTAKKIAAYNNKHHDDLPDIRLLYDAYKKKFYLGDA